MKKIIVLMLLGFFTPALAQEAPPIINLQGSWNIKQGPAADYKTCVAEYIDPVSSYYYSMNYDPFSESMAVIISSPEFAITKEFMKQGPLLAFFDGEYTFRMPAQVKRLNETTYIVFMKKPFKNFYSVISSSQYFVLNAGKEFLPFMLPNMDGVFEKVSNCFEKSNLTEEETNNQLLNERYNRYDKYLDRNLDGFYYYIENRNEKFIEYLFKDFNNLKLYKHEYGDRFSIDNKISGQINSFRAIPNLNSYVNLIKELSIQNGNCETVKIHDVEDIGPTKIFKYQQKCSNNELKYFVQGYLIVNNLNSNTLKIEFLSKEKMEEDLNSFESKLYMK